MLFFCFHIFFNRTVIALLNFLYSQLFFIWYFGSCMLAPCCRSACKEHQEILVKFVPIYTCINSYAYIHTRMYAFVCMHVCVCTHITEIKIVIFTNMCYLSCLIVSQALQKVSNPDKIYLKAMSCQVTFGMSPMNFVCFLYTQVDDFIKMKEIISSLDPPYIIFSIPKAHSAQDLILLPLLEL